MSNLETEKERVELSNSFDKALRIIEGFKKEGDSERAALALAALSIDLGEIQRKIAVPLRETSQLLEEAGEKIESTKTPINNQSSPSAVPQKEHSSVAEEKG